MSGRIWEIGYGDGWDPARRCLVGMVPEDAARERDRDGTPYTVVAWVDGTPARIVDVDHTHGYCAVWRLGSDGRRHRRMEYRRLTPDEYTLVGIDHWRYRPNQADPSPDAWHQREQFDTELSAVWIHEPSGVRGRPLEPGEAWTRPVPEFGDWASLLDSTEALAATGFDPRDPGPDPAPAPDVPLWRAPRPLQPDGLDTILTPGLTYRLDDGLGGEYEVRTRIVDGPSLPLPSGHLVGADPLVERPGPYTVTLPPGTYRTSAVVAVGADTEEIAAIRVHVRDEPVARWQMAVRADQDVRLLGDGEYLGIGVDGGIAALMDASADAVPEDADEPPLGVPVAWVDGTVVAFRCPIGDGLYPVWIGWTGDGAVACVVAELELLRGVPAVAD
jgi:hypothetical protein